MTRRPILLKALLRQRHWQTYGTFCGEYDRAAWEVDPKLVGSAPSRAQLHRWLSGELRGLPYAHHCRVLERMLPGWSAQALFGPRPDDVPAVPEPAGVAEVTSSRSGVPADGGTAAARSTVYPLDVAESIDMLGALSGGDLDDDAAVTGSAWTSDATTGAITGYLFGHSLQSGTRAGETAGSPDAAAIGATAAHPTDLDFRFGGGYTRRTLLFYFRAEVVPPLRASHPEPARRDLFPAAAEMAQLIGWSAYDEGRHGAAQRYFVQALRGSRGP